MSWLSEFVRQGGGRQIAAGVGLGGVAESFWPSRPDDNTRLPQIAGLGRPEDGQEDSGDGSWIGDLASSALNTAVDAGQQYLSGKIDQSIAQDSADKNLERLQGLGLTPQEIVGGSAGGGISGTTLGNTSALAQARHNRQMVKQQQAQMQMTAVENQANRTNNLQIAGLQADSANRRTAMEYALGNRRLKLEEAKHGPQMTILQNNAATSHKDFIVFTKMLGMSPANVAAAAAFNNLSVNPLDPKEFQKLTIEQRHQIIEYLSGIGSAAYGSGQGLAELFKRGTGSLGVPRPESDIFAPRSP